jgi:hypothetical protein
MTEAFWLEALKVAAGAVTGVAGALAGRKLLDRRRAAAVAESEPTGRIEECRFDDDVPHSLEALSRQIGETARLLGRVSEIVVVLEDRTRGWRPPAPAAAYVAESRSGGG